MNRPGLARRSQLSRERSLGGVVVTVVLGLDFCWGSVGQRGAQPGVVKPAEHGELEVVGALPRSFPVDEFGLVEALSRPCAVSACSAVTGSSRLLSVRLAPSITQPIGMPKRSVAIDHFPQRVHRTAPVARWASVGRR